MTTGRQLDGRRHAPQQVRALSVVIPVFNSEDTIGALVDSVIGELGSRYERVEVVLVDDGSQDESYAKMLAARERYPNLVTTVRLARNFGEHNAVMCGLGEVTGDAVAIIDDDFQNPPLEIVRLVEKEDGQSTATCCRCTRTWRLFSTCAAALEWRISFAH